jgi:hypothetical protein
MNLSEERGKNGIKRGGIKVKTFLLLAASSASLTKAVPSAVTCCIR